MNAHWSARPEGGGRFAIRLIRAIGQRGGRSLARACLYPITLYFYFRRPYERRVSYAYLARVRGRPATAVEVMRHIHAFAATILDRMFLLTERYRRFDVRVEGLETLTSRMRRDRGVLLLGAHVGSFEVLRVLADGVPDVAVHVVLDTQKTPALTALLHELNPRIAGNVIDGARPGAEIVLAMDEALRAGGLVTLLADRARPHERTLAVPFLGSPAPFPTAAAQIAATLKVPVVLCIGLYRGGNRYDVHFEALAEAAEWPRRDRERDVAALVARYAERLEHHVRDAPYNWFNWHDFWNLDHARGELPALDRVAVPRGGT
jgi:predicted LPLAT superfamily acyltransferase